MLSEAVRQAADKRRPYHAPAISLAEFVERTGPWKLHAWQRILCDILERCVTEKGLRFLIHGPPQLGKSFIVSQRLIPYALGMDPSIKCVLSCYNQETSEGFTKIQRAIMESDEYLKLFPDHRARISRTSGAAGRFNTVARDAFGEAANSVRAVGLNSGLTGTGPNLLICDDPYGSFADASSEAINKQIYDYFWNGTAKPRIGDQDNIIWMFHRYTPNDIAGRLLAEGGWEYVRFPAIADENEDGSDPTGREAGELLSPLRSRDWFEAIRDNDPLSWWGLFQGLPRNPEGNLFKIGDFQICEPEDVPKNIRWVRSWDIASKTKTQNDWSAGAKTGIIDRNLYIADVKRVKKQYPDLRELVIETSNDDGANVPIGIEDKVAGLALVPDLQRDPRMTGRAVYPLQVSTDKYSNALPWAAMGRDQRLYLVRGPWNQAFINECLSFRGDNNEVNDQVDSVSRSVQLQTYIGATSEQIKTPPARGTKEYYDALRAQHSAGSKDD